MQFFTDLFRKDAVASDVHVTTALGNERDRKRAKMFRAFVSGGTKPVEPVEVEAEAEKRDAWSITVPVSKVDEEIGVIYGWASVIEEGGQVVTDHQDDQITVTDLLKAAHDFMLTSRTGGLMHWRDGDAPLKGGDVVESMVVTHELRKAFDFGGDKVGWVIGYKPHDPEVLALAKAGTLSAFSIGGRGIRVPV